jgi:hypothetical protein
MSNAGGGNAGIAGTADIAVTAGIETPRTT